MKHILLFLVVILLSRQAFAQSDIAVQAQLTSIFSNIDKSQIPSGYLGEYGSDFVEKRLYNGIPSDSNFILNISGFRFMYIDIVSSRIYNNALTMPGIDEINNVIDSLQDSSSTALAFLTAQYASINDNAINMGLFTSSNNQLSDVATRTQNPYILKQIFASAPINEVSEITGSISLRWTTGLSFTNSGQNITHVWIDFLDGQGYIPIALNGSVNKVYTDSSGYKKFKIKVQCTNGEILYTSSQQYVHVNNTNSGQGMSNRYAGLSQIELANPNYIAYGGSSIFPVFSPGNFLSGKVYIRYSKKRIGTNLQNKIVKPFIVVEGYDIHDVAPAISEENYDINDLITEWDNLYFTQGYDFNSQLDDSAGYDLIFIDYHTMEAIPRNARMLENVINWVNANKHYNANGVLEKNVVMGISMGGLVSRYCLAQMTKEGKITDTRLLLTHDSPHQGANVP